ncbi:MAG: 50S ribosomal protein L30 [Candidatus Diapherotrites archaeon]|nr:50S ribosomal protein L30 [Candidatus Diapherotrites archaeon]
MAYAVVLVRGMVNTRQEIRDTLRRLRLTRVNHCVVVPESETFKGLLRTAQGYVTWGEIDKDTLSALLLKWGRFEGDVPVTQKEIESKTGMSWDKFLDAVLAGEISLADLGIKPFRLHPPRKGYGRNGIKRHFNEGGALGYRGEKINELLRRMI